MSIVINAKSWSDISDELKEAAKHTANSGGAILIPADIYRLSKPVNFGGSDSNRHTLQSVNPTGHGCTLIYEGPDEIDTAALDFPCPYRCRIEGIRVVGADGANYRRVAGIRLHGGLNHDQNGGKSNVVDQCHVENMGVGFQLGGYLNPDMVGNTFRSCSVDWCRHGWLIHGANVASTSLYDPTIGYVEESGIKIIAHPGRQIRTSPLDHKVFGDMLADWEGNEIFWGKLERGAKRRIQFQDAHGRVVPWVGGGSLGVRIYSMTAHVENASAWIIDTNWGHVEVYGCRSEGHAGVFRSSVMVGGGNYRSVIENLTSVSHGGVRGYAIEQAGGVPLDVIGGTYAAPFAVGPHHQVELTRVRFEKYSARRTNMEESDVVGEHISLLVESPKPYGRGMMREIKIRQPDRVGELVPM